MTHLSRCHVEADCEREVTFICPICRKPCCDYHGDAETDCCIPCTPFETEADIIAYLIEQDELADERRMDA